MANGHDRRFLGIDLGAETIKVVELAFGDEGGLRQTRSTTVEHGKKPEACLATLLHEWGVNGVHDAAVTGRLGRIAALPRVPAKRAIALGYSLRFGKQPATIVSIGSHGFSVLELRENGMEIFRENSRCSQGTGNFLRQLVERFSLGIEEASEMCAGIQESAPLSGRCPVILKTDMTHLANKGEDRLRILAGLFDAVCENVLTLIKPGISPGRVILAGGVSRSRRVRDYFRRALVARGMELVELNGETLYLEATGSAMIAARGGGGKIDHSRLVRTKRTNKLERLPPLADSLHLVRRMQRPVIVDTALSREVVLGFDIGSTGSKVVALDAESRETVWEGYRQTAGDPVGAAQALLRTFVESPAARHRVLALGATGSGREIVGSLMTTCYSKDAVFILNEIAAHAEGARHYDPRVDTIFEIGGQDAKYSRLSDGRVVDCAMNEACSAGTGSFIEEQGRKFSGIRDVAHLGEEALAATEGVSLGQHCSVFMAEIIDEAVALGLERRTIIAGLYDSIVQNYLHRVKGSRSVGQVIFCQGMPFSSDALAAAVARQTGCQVIIPPNPGTVGALGIALLALKELQCEGRVPLELTRFLGAQIEAKETFVCRSNRGCGGAGNHCRIDCLKTLVSDRHQKFTWGGGCGLYDKGTRKRKLPDLSPDPFREREELVQQLIGALPARAGRPSIGLTDEFSLKALMPFFATFLHELGFNLVIPAGADQATLKRGIQEANVPFCAPMQLFHGLVSRLAESKPDYLFLPMLRSLPHVGDEKLAVTCPIVQAGPDLVRWDLQGTVTSRVVSPVIDMGEGNLASDAFHGSCHRLALELGLTDSSWRAAFARARLAQEQFEAACVRLGARALAFCHEHDLVPVVVLGRPYTIHNKVLNSNVPSILREQGVIGIPLDCYPVGADMPIFSDMYWGYGQRILRAAHQVRRTPGTYAVYCSNYSCGPDSFNLHFFSYIMEGKPFAIIETDGHSGDAGTKTRIEAFLYCVFTDLKSAESERVVNEFERLRLTDAGPLEIKRRGERLLVPRLGSVSDVMMACFRGTGMQVEALPLADSESLRLGRRHTSGKECLPMTLTLGNLLKRMEACPDDSERFVLVMPRTFGPCRFGVYHVWNQIVLERLGWRDRVRIWAPSETGYFDTLPAGFSMLIASGFAAADMLEEGFHDALPAERSPGEAREILARYNAELFALLEREAATRLPLARGFWEVWSGRLFGAAELLTRAAAEFRAAREDTELPTVLITGELYVRCDAFSNDFVREKLGERGIRTRLAPFSEYMEYTDLTNRMSGRNDLGAKIGTSVQKRILDVAYRTMGAALGWPERGEAAEAVAVAQPYVRKELIGEAIMTVGGPLHEWKAGHIDAALCVGPFECMPSKIAEAQHYHTAERDGLLAQTLTFNGDPVDPEVLDNFAFEVRSRFEARKERERLSV